MIEVLLERDAPLAQLQALLTEVAAGQGASVVVTGEAGAGKTTFFQAFVAEVGTRARVFRAACEDLSIPEPLGAVYELARSAGWDLDRLKDGQRLDAFAQILEQAHDPEQPTILIIEDLHWADEASLDFVRYVARRIAPLKIMLLINSRDLDETAQQRLRVAFNGVPADHLTRISLQALSQQAVSDLAAQAGLNGAEVFQKSAGNAFYVAELLRSRDQTMPLSVQDAVLARVDRLSDKAQAILQAISIFPRRAELDLVFSVCGGEDYPSIEACIAEGLLDAEGDYLSYRHEIARLAVENGLSAFKKRALNTSLFTLLETREATPKARLMHHAQAGRLSDKMRDLAPQAAREAEAAGALRQSAEYFSIALTYLDTLSPEKQADLLEDAGLVFGSQQDQKKAIELLEKALACRQALHQTLASVMVMCKLVVLCWSTGDRRVARDFGDQAIVLAEGSNGIELARAYAARAHIAMIDFDLGYARGLAQKAVDLAEEHGFTEVLSYALSTLGMCFWMDQDHGVSLLRRGRELAVENGFFEIGPRGFVNYAINFNEHLRYRDSFVAYDEGAQYCLQNEIPPGLFLMRAWQLDPMEQMGQWDDVLSRSSGMLSEEITHFSAHFYVHLIRARIAIRRGLPEVDERIEQLRALLDQETDHRHLSYFAILLAEKAFLGLGDKTEALELMAKAYGMPVYQPYAQRFFMWQKRLGKTPEFREDEVQDKPYRCGLSGDWQGEADAWAELENPYNEALALADGDAAAKTRSLEILDRLGAVVVADFVRDRMRNEGISIKTKGPRSSTKAHPAGLTKRQIDVLRLLNDGLSNAEIGEKLFVSAKTVDHHVSAILGKLNVASRGEAAALARDAGWV